MSIVFNPTPIYRQIPATEIPPTRWWVWTVGPAASPTDFLQQTSVSNDGCSCDWTSVPCHPLLDSLSIHLGDAVHTFSLPQKEAVQLQCFDIRFPTSRSAQQYKEAEMAPVTFMRLVANTPTFLRKHQGKVLDRIQSELRRLLDRLESPDGRSLDVHRSHTSISDFLPTTLERPSSLLTTHNNKSWNPWLMQEVPASDRQFLEARRGGMIGVSTKQKNTFPLALFTHRLVEMLLITNSNEGRTKPLLLLVSFEKRDACVNAHQEFKAFIGESTFPVDSFTSLEAVEKLVASWSPSSQPKAVVWHMDNMWLNMETYPDLERLQSHFEFGAIVFSFVTPISITKMATNYWLAQLNLIFPAAGLTEMLPIWMLTSLDTSAADEAKIEDKLDSNHWKEWTFYFPMFKYLFFPPQWFDCQTMTPNKMLQFHDSPVRATGRKLKSQNDLFITGFFSLALEQKAYVWQGQEDAMDLQPFHPASRPWQMELPPPPPYSEDIPPPPPCPEDVPPPPPSLPVEVMRTEEEAVPAVREDNELSPSVSSSMSTTTSSPRRRKRSHDDLFCACPYNPTVDRHAKCKSCQKDRRMAFLERELTGQSSPLRSTHARDDESEDDQVDLSTSPQQRVSLLQDSLATLTVALTEPLLIFHPTPSPTMSIASQTGPRYEVKLLGIPHSLHRYIVHNGRTNLLQRFVRLPLCLQGSLQELATNVVHLMKPVLSLMNELHLDLSPDKETKRRRVEHPTRCVLPHCPYRSEEMDPEVHTLIYPPCHHPLHRKCFERMYITPAGSTDSGNFVDSVGLDSEHDMRPHGFLCIHCGRQYPLALHSVAVENITTTYQVVPNSSSFPKYTTKPFLTPELASWQLPFTHVSFCPKLPALLLAIQRLIESEGQNHDFQIVILSQQVSPSHLPWLLEQLQGRLPPDCVITWMLLDAIVPPSDQPARIKSAAYNTHVIVVDNLALYEHTVETVIRQRASQWSDDQSMPCTVTCLAFADSMEERKLYLDGQIGPTLHWENEWEFNMSPIVQQMARDVLANMSEIEVRKTDPNFPADELARLELATTIAYQRYLLHVVV